MNYTVAPHLHYFTIPLADFMAARPEIEGFGVGAYIFSRADPTPRILLLQRAESDSMPGCWEGPGGACEPETDQTLLDSLVRETQEESGLHVSHVVGLVAVDCWEHHRRSGGRIRIAKYSFIVEVHESSQLGKTTEPVPTVQIPVQLDATEHQAFDWATEEDVHLSVKTSRGPYKFPLHPMGHQAPNILRAFELVEGKSDAA
ncbi:unnamed protein product [Penicillium salamii]|uniref:Nudix hydrolase domain-containing protein n=1 Tax=Penicillium salamii TaxID=1612424 RepID=A0A9W4IKE5_9EURO|nr:unnamed protein product [Penicillium salamii]CAG8066612.1 unnamed protein product [Penicillium salamii]CAG8261713.1 unnamed protein product [Penicillium salamii]CAG8314937.1 unnamed protein product [Penicillium salamii]CAG8322517.1 unnamed protein product [Penicillium salamii]